MWKKKTRMRFYVSNVSLFLQRERESSTLVRMFSPLVKMTFLLFFLSLLSFFFLSFSSLPVIIITVLVITAIRFSPIPLSYFSFHPHPSFLSFSLSFTLFLSTESLDLILLSNFMKPREKMDENRVTLKERERVRKRKN